MTVLTDRQDHCVLTNVSTFDPTTKEVNSCKEGLLQELTLLPPGLGRQNRLESVSRQFVNALESRSESG